MVAAIKLYKTFAVFQHIVSLTCYLTRLACLRIGDYMALIYSANAINFPLCFLCVPCPYHHIHLVFL